MTHRCFFCEHTEEDIEHVFLNCRVISKVWDLFGAAAGISWNDMGSLQDRLLCEEPVSLTTVGRTYWELLIQAIAWGLWIERTTDGSKVKIGMSMELCDIKCLVAGV